MTFRERLLHFAKNAVDYTKWTLVIGASNIESNVEKTGGWSQESVLRMRRAPVKWVHGEWQNVDIGPELGMNQPVVVPQLVRDKDKGFVYDLPGPLKKPDKFDRAHVQTLARRATAARTGNCQEHAAVAYGWLYEHARFVSSWTYISVPDHAFVVLNRNDTESMGKTKAFHWGAEAVLCDPWGGFVCTQPQLMRAQGETEYALEGHRDEQDMSFAAIQKWICDHDAEVHAQEWRMYMRFDSPKFY
ncbi:hypothetical protein [Enhygromyxa salina]|nr:hypothetical protein [Enhygromyxa salina]